LLPDVPETLPEETIYNQRKTFMQNRILNFFQNPPNSHTELTLNVRFLTTEDKIELATIISSKGYEFTESNGIAKLLTKK
jgi:hypothetical protein